MKDLFTGSLGRLNNHGGSRICTTPNTILVPPEYEIETGLPANYDFITCSLDGRLWLFKNGSALYVIALKWNEQSKKLEFIKSKILFNENFIARGMKWILTNKSIIFISDKEPYIVYKDTDFTSIELIIHNGSSPSIQNLTDIFSVKNFYSLLPTIDNWQIIENCLISNDKGIFPLTSLILNCDTGDNINAYINFTPYLICFNNEFWALGYSYIGKVYLLPRTFDKNGEVKEYYLYISPEYINNEMSNNMGITPIGDSLYCFYLKDNQGLCITAQDNKIYSSKTKEWINHSENENNIFFDTFNYTSLILEKNKIKLLPSEKSIEAKGISQWIAPTEQIEDISGNMIVSSNNKQVLVTYLTEGLYREILLNKELPLSYYSYDKNRISLGTINKNNQKFIHANKVKSLRDNTQNISWGNIYKPIVNLKFINEFTTTKKLSYSFPFFYEYNDEYEDDYTQSIIMTVSERDFEYAYLLFGTDVDDYPWGTFKYNVVSGGVDSETGYVGFNYISNFNVESIVHIGTRHYKYYYINPDTGKLNFAGTGSSKIYREKGTCLIAYRAYSSHLYYRLPKYGEIKYEIENHDDIEVPNCLKSWEEISNNNIDDIKCYNWYPYRHIAVFRIPKIKKLYFYIKNTIFTCSDGYYRIKNENIVIHIGRESKTISSFLDHNTGRYTYSDEYTYYILRSEYYPELLDSDITRQRSMQN